MQEDKFRVQFDFILGDDSTRTECDDSLSNFERNFLSSLLQVERLYVDKYEIIQCLSLSSTLNNKDCKRKYKTFPDDLTLP